MALTSSVAKVATAGTFALVLALTGCSGGANGAGGTGSAAGGEEQHWETAAPESGTEVPQVDVKFGMRPYADNTFYVIGMQEGWYQDAGITIDPSPTGLSTAENQWTNLLLNGTTDINSSTCATILPVYTTSTQLKCAAHAVTYFGAITFANPSLGLMTVQDYVDAGQSFDETLTSALSPLSGQQVYVPPGVTEKVFNEAPFETVGLEKPNYQTSEDSDMLLLAKSGQINFLHPAGAPIAYELLQMGWTPVYSTQMLLDNGPTGADSPFTGLVSNNGLAATADWLDENQNTMLRFESVMYRIADAVAADPSLFDQQAPYLNAQQGTSQTGADLAAIFSTLHPLTTFDEAAKYYVDTTSPEYYSTVGQAQIDSFVDRGLLPEGITPDDYIWAADIYNDLLDYKTKTDALFGRAEGETLDPDRAAELEQAHQYYDWFNFLDAYRFAAAALGESTSTS